MNKMKAMKIAVPACICAVVLIILAAVLMNGKDSKTWKDYYDLGMQYLKEENYEEAIVAFTSAIELDSRQAVVYIGRGDAYAGLAEREEKQGDLEEAKELYENAADDYEQAVELGEKEEAADKLKRIQAAIDRLAEKIADLEEDQMDSQEQENVVDESSESGDNDNATAANTGAPSGNRVNTGTNTNTNVNTNTRPGGTTTENPESTTSESGTLKLQEKVNTYMNTYYEKTKADVIIDFGTDYELRNRRIDGGGNTVEEIYYPNEGIGFDYYDEYSELAYEEGYYGLLDDGVMDFIVYSDEIDLGNGLRGGMTYPELEASFTGEVEVPEYNGDSWYATCLSNDGEVWFDRALGTYKWEDDPYTTAGEFHTAI